MNERISSLWVFVLAVANAFAANVWDGSIAASFTAGEGTSASPYQISNGAELALFANKVSAGEKSLNAVLTDDIYLNENSENYAEWGDKPPVNEWKNLIGLGDHKFCGMFDGQGHKVYGAYLDKELSAEWYGVGLFGNIGENAVIKNLGVERSYFSVWGNVDGTKNTADPHVGVFAGTIYAAHLTNVSASGVVKVNATSSMTSVRYAETGCFAGYVYNRSVIVNGTADCVVESAFEKASTGAIHHSLGGFIGKVSGTVFIENVYSRSYVKNTSKTAATATNIGGIIGILTQKTDTLYNAYYNISTVGEDHAPEAAVGNVVGVTKNVASKTTAKMKSEEFASLLGPAFTYTANANDGYPQLVVFEGAAAFDGGDGSEQSPYLIGSAKALRAVSGLVNGMNAEYGNKHYKMTADVELNEDSETYKSWETTPPEFSWFQIGREYHRKDAVSVDCGNDAYACSKDVFSGVFDGNFHKVKGLYLNDTTNQSQGGLFNAVDHATIKNLGVTNSYISVIGRAGGILGFASYSKIDSCFNESEIRSISQDNGGLAGVIFNTEISNSYNKGNLKITKLTLSAHSNGGIVGEVFRDSKVRNVWNSGNINAVFATAGGIAGLCDSSLIENVYNRGLVSTDSGTGGIVGNLRISGTILNAYNTGVVSSKIAAKRGGIVGVMSERTSPKVRNVVSDCYFDSQTIGVANAAAIGITAGTVKNTSGLPTATMTTGRFAIMLGEAFKQDDKVNDGYPTFLGKGETYGVKDIFAGGDGSEEKPFLIATATQLRNMEYLVNQKNAEYGASHYKLIADIILNENTDQYANWATTAPANTWTPMGTSETASFKGVFDGGNYSISGIYTNTKYSGLFGFVASVAVVKNLTIKESLVKTTAAGGIVGSVVAFNKGRIHNVHNTGNVNANMTTTGTVIGGGVVGFNNEGIVDSSSNAGVVNILGSSKGNRVITGGVVGKDLRGVLDDLKNTGSVTGQSVSNSSVVGKALTGGVVGYAAHSKITHAVNEGRVYSRANDSGTKAQAWVRIGGILGADSISSTVKWCVNKGDVDSFVSSLFDTDISVINGGGIVGDQLEGTSYIGFCRNEGNVTAHASYANSRSEIGGILGYNRGTVTIEYCYTSGLLHGKSTATSSPKSVMNQIGGIVARLTSTSVVRGCFSYMNVKSTLEGSSKTAYVGGIVGANAGNIIASYYDKTVTSSFNVVTENTGTLTKALALTTEEMQTNEFAWKLNTLGGDAENAGVFTRYNDYPFFADEKHLPIYRVIFDDAVSVYNAYTSYSGYVQAPANPEPAPGEMFVGWHDGDKFMLQNRQVIDKDMTLRALFTKVTDPIYFITFVDGGDVYVKATENTGMIETLPTAKNIPMGYHFDGWFDNVTNKEVTTETIFSGKATVVAKYSANLYKITFLDYDGSEISSLDEPYGKMPTVPKAPVREPVDGTGYKFTGWDSEVAIVTGEASYKAVYESYEIVSSSSTESSSSSANSSSSSVKSSSSSSKEKSSSSSVESSSSEEIASSSSSSRNDEKSSSSSVKSSSSSVKSSSSSSKAKSSSSSVKSSSSSSKVKSSSSSVKSSSSSSKAKSSSSSVKSSSSSSKAKSSSSSVKSNSSSSKAKSSSSSVKSSSSKAKSSSSKAKSSSSKSKNALPVIALMPQLKITTVGRDVQIAGAREGVDYAVLDLQGRVVMQGSANAANFNLSMPRAGRYMVRVGSRQKLVAVK